MNDCRMESDHEPSLRALCFVGTLRPCFFIQLLNEVRRCLTPHRHVTRSATTAGQFWVFSPNSFRIADSSWTASVISFLTDPSSSTICCNNDVKTASSMSSPFCRKCSAVTRWFFIPRLPRCDLARSATSRQVLAFS
jgi:hypothetical protein